ncbi:SDR family NAD(P)-dependent oxidoreductase [Granulicella sp. WH15]|uniref:oxidoreductase n=1 Tax=Granulicella sp. WH15 TaxID=2602070 RepID=UPI001366C8FF|nr:oxidoreductase [Granulicella sp. WH15]QHN03336.1 SDR family NAD(P)-dependent oxidoreductase [Granulicella sp. WH15]
MAAWTTHNIPSQAGKLAVVTGANSGIGWNTALELARAGASVILTARSREKGEDAVHRIQRLLPSAQVRYEQLDLASLASVHGFAAKIGSELKLDLLVNNAGVMRIPTRELTEDGFEKQFGTNYLGHFALTLLLLPLLQRSPAPRVTSVSSGAASMGLKKINFDDLQFEKTYAPWKVYCQSKLANLLFMQELARRSAAQGIPLLSNAAHPGWASTNLQSSGPGRPLNRFENFIQNRFSQNSAQGALPTLRAATAPDTRSGEYFAPGGTLQLTGSPILVPLPKPAQNSEAARKLWDVSEQLTKVEWPVTNSTRAAFLRS